MQFEKHNYHLVDPSPWPAIGAIGCIILAFGAVIYFGDGATEEGVFFESNVLLSSKKSIREDRNMRLFLFSPNSFCTSELEPMTTSFVVLGRVFFERRSSCFGGVD